MKSERKVKDISSRIKTMTISISEKSQIQGRGIICHKEVCSILIKMKSIKICPE